MSKNVVIFNFSPRIDGNCSKIDTYISNYHGSDVRKFHFTAENCMPCSGCHYECLNSEQKCTGISGEMKRALTAASESDLLYMIVPNICGYPCANYFAFNEKCVGYFGLDRDMKMKYMKVPKKFIVVSNTESDNFKNAMKQHSVDEPDILYLKTSKYHKSSTAGDLMDSDNAKVDLEAFLSH